MTSLQKIVVLCLIVIAAGSGYYFAKQNPIDDAVGNQNNPGERLPVNPNPNIEDDTVEPREPILEPPKDLPPREPVACTMDAKMCPDGSFVGRVAPNCNFAPCSEAEPIPVPKPKDGVVMCNETMKYSKMCTDIYQPVCGLVQVQCIQAPCPPVEETFSNGCYACLQGNVISYTEGACEATY